MEWFFSILDKIVESFIWKRFISHFIWVDWFTLAFILVGLIYGMRRGFIRELVEFLEILFVLFLTFTFYKDFAYFLHQFIPALPSNYAPCGAYFMLFTAIFSVVFFVDNVVGKWFHTKLAGPLRGIGGAVMGVATILLLWGIISYGITLIPMKKVQKQFDKGNSASGYYVRMIVPNMYLALTDPDRLIHPKKDDKKE